MSSLHTLFPKSVVISVFFPNQVQASDNQPVTETIPRKIMSFYHPHYQKMSNSELQQESQRVFEGQLRVTDADLAKCTQLQSQSSVWFEHRKGRLTASKFRAICHTSISKPSESLISQVFQQNPSPQSAAIKWGVEKESTARAEYEELLKMRHSEFKVEITGLHINPHYPYLGASPDGLTNCTCCGDGILQIKCPYSVRQSVPTDAPFLHTDIDGEYKLSTSHEYYYQVQGQLGVTGRLFADFVCWTPQGLHIERIMYDPKFFDDMELKLRQFFIQVLLPRVLCGDHANKQNVHVQHESELTNEMYMYNTRVNLQEATLHEIF